MKILHVNDTKLKLGGAETYLYDLMDLQEKAGHEVKLFGGGKFNTITSFVSRFYDPFVLLRFLKLVNDFEPDVIHAHGIMRNISPSVLHVAKLKKIPVVMTVHDFHLVCPTTWFVLKDGSICKNGFGKECFFNSCSGSKKGVFGLPYNSMRNLKLVLHRKIIKNNVDFFITPSEFLEKWVKKSLDIDNIESIPYFVKIKKTKRVNIPKEKNVLFVGRISEEKGLKHLIRSISLVIKKIPEVKLVIVGSGPAEQEMKGEIRSLGIEKNVDIVGWVKKEDIGKFYEESSLVVVPSIWTETFGIVAVEAMSKGKPVIVNKFAGGLREIVQNGVNGYFANVKDNGELSSKIIEILSDDKKLKKFSEKSLEMSDKYLNGKNHLEKIDKIYNFLLTR